MFLFENGLGRLEEPVSLPVFILSSTFVYTFCVYFCLFFCLPCDLSFIAVIIISRPGDLTLSRNFLVIAYDLFLRYVPRLFILIYTEALYFTVLFPFQPLPGINIAQYGQAVSVNFTKQRHPCVTLEQRKCDVCYLCLSIPSPDLSSMCLPCR